eukprot:3531429-Rhodomonas_salina.2
MPDRAVPRVCVPPDSMTRRGKVTRGPRRGTRERDGSRFPFPRIREPWSPVGKIRGPPHRGNRRPRDRADIWCPGDSTRADTHRRRH